MDFHAHPLLSIVILCLACLLCILAVDPLKEGLKRHNEYRARHESTPPLRLNSNVSSVAQKWADKLLTDNKFEHSTGSKFGENLWTCYGCKYSSEEAVRKAVDSWYDEIKSYDWNHPGFKSEVGHFTALIWKGATHVGVGVARNEKRIVVVSNYWPTTNIVGEFRKNVLPIK